MIGVIADDLSGAAELGALGWRRGWRAEIVLRGEIRAGPELVCGDTNSRLLGPAEAAERMKTVAKWVSGARPRWIYKKMDSVLRGNVIAELEALMRCMGLQRALMVPANPSLNRVIRGDRYFVGGKPIDETEFARDPSHPRTSSSVLALLGPSREFPIQVCGPRDELPQSGIIVGEAQTMDDLHIWASRVQPGMLAAGAAQFFGALLDRELSGSPRIEARPQNVSGPELFVCGSTSESSTKFIEEERSRATPVFSLPPELACGACLSTTDSKSIACDAEAALQRHGRVVLCVGLPLVLEHSIAQGLAGQLVDVATRVLRAGKIRRVYAEGGATAATLVREMGWERLTLIRELALGVATVAVNGEEHFQFTMKPGSYVWPDEIRENKKSL